MREPGQAAAFDGDRQRRDFFKLLKVTDPSLPPEELPDSARQTLLRKTNEAGLPPLPLLRTDATHKVSFDNYSLGDAMGQAYAAGLLRMAEQGAVVEELHLASNGLGPVRKVHCYLGLA
jgi:hypothetical protein